MYQQRQKRTGHGPIDFAEAKRLVSIREVLELLNWKETSRRGPQLRGPCPVHKSTNEKSRSFSVNLERNAFQCFGKKCEAKGNQLDLYAAVTGLQIYDSTTQLFEKLGRELPRLKRHG